MIPLIIIHAVFHVQPEQETAFLGDIQPLIAGSKAESGNIYYDLCKDTGRKQVYVMVEAWKDAEAVAFHNETEHFKSFISKAGTYLSEPADVKVYNAQLQ